MKISDFVSLSMDSGAAIRGASLPSLSRSTTKPSVTPGYTAILQIRGEKPIRSINNHDATALAKAQQRIKSQLPFRSAHYYQFKDNKRRQANIIPESFLFQTTIDVDEKELVERALERAKLLDSLDFIPDDTGERGASTAAGGSDAETENRAASGGSNDETGNRAAAVGNHDGG